MSKAGSVIPVLTLSRVELARYLEPVIRKSQKLNQLYGYLILRLTCCHEINVTYGYKDMNDLLHRCIKRIQNTVRRVDHQVHVSESEIAVLLPNMLTAEHAILAANRLHSELSCPFRLDGELVNITLTIGAAVMPHHASTATELMLKADMALEKALFRQSPYEMYEDLSEHTHPPRVRLAHDLKAAIAQNDLELYYQPKIDLQTSRISSVEALTRWPLEDGTFVDPELFISVAEQSGLIGALTQWTLNVGCRQARTWKDRYNSPVSIALNISTAVLHDMQTVDTIMHALDLWDADPASITLEVTESIMMQQPEQSLDCMKRLRELGIRLSIDDFGTGYSSLSYLKRLPVNELKIDKSFVLKMAEDRGDLTMVRSIIDLARNFNLEVIAEGVENQQSLDWLVAMGCGQAQGYFIGEPMTAADMDKWLENSPWGLNQLKSQISR